MERVERARFGFGRENARRVDWPREQNAARRNRLEPEPSVVGLVADEHDEANALSPRMVERPANQTAAMTFAGEIGIHGERSKQKDAQGTAHRHIGQSHRRDQPIVQERHPAEARQIRGSLANAVGRARKSAGAKNTGVQRADLIEILLRGLP